MCEFHPYECTSCGIRWLDHRKLASCESPDPAARCPERLSMYVGNPEKPQQTECDACLLLREAIQELQLPSLPQWQNGDNPDTR